MAQRHHDIRPTPRRSGGSDFWFCPSTEFILLTLLCKGQFACLLFDGVYPAVHTSTPLRMTAAGLRMTEAGLSMTAAGLRMKICDRNCEGCHKDKKALWYKISDLRFLIFDRKDECCHQGTKAQISFSDAKMSVMHPTFWCPPDIKLRGRADTEFRQRADRMLGAYNLNFLTISGQQGNF